MKNTFKNILSAVAAIALSVPAFAQEQDWSAIKTNKTATYDAANDKVDITLETFVNGYKSNIWTPATVTQMPLDIVLVLDVSGSMGYEMGRDRVASNKADNRLTALKNACYAFIDTIAVNANRRNAEHQISIVKFAGTLNETKIGNDLYNGTATSEISGKLNYTQIVKGLTSVKGDGAASLKSEITNLVYGGGTDAGNGLKLANTILSAVPSDRESIKMVVMFTDGEPDNYSDPIDQSNKLKNNQVKVYTVGTFSNNDNDVINYMNYTSSNYTNSSVKENTILIIFKSYEFSGTHEDDKYSMNASSADELKNVFVTISKDAQETTDGSKKGAGANLAAENEVTLKDVVTSNFVIPQTNGAPTDIKLTLVPVDSVKVKSGATRNAETHAPAYSDYEIIWATDPSKFETITPAEGQVSVEGNTLNVDGKVFDFSSNWVGVREVWTQGKTSADSTYTIHGKKLVISFSVKPDPTKTGGEVYTNTDESGVYVGDDKVSQEKKTDYDVPKPVFVPANITIRKSGMLPGESAIFEVTATGTDYSKTYTVAMTANEAGEMKDAVIMRVPIVTNPNAEANGEDLDWISYTVKETSWSWAYTSDQPSITRTMTNDPATHLFEFKNTPKSETPKHGEGNANNIFAK